MRCFNPNCLQKGKLFKSKGGFSQHLITYEACSNYFHQHTFMQINNLKTNNNTNVSDYSLAPSSEVYKSNNNKVLCSDKILHKNISTNKEYNNKL